EIAGGATLAIAQRQTVQSPTASRENVPAPRCDNGAQWHVHHIEMPSAELDSNSVVSRKVPRDGSKPRPRVRSDIITYIEKYKAQNGRLPSGPNISEIFNVPISTAYLYRSRAVADTSNVVAKS